MSKMKYDCKPPLAVKSPIRLRRSFRSNSASLQTPPGSLTKSQKPIRTKGMEESDIQPEYHSISCDIRALARMVRDEIGNGEPVVLDEATIINCCSVFKRGRFYDEYSARRNERLKRKKGETEIESKTGRYLSVTVESSKRRGSSKKIESLRKSEIETPRYLLRSMNKENKKPPLAVSSVTATKRKTTARTIGKL